MLNKHLAIDIGSSRSRLFLEGQGLILDIPTIVAVQEETEQIIAIGEKAEKMRGRIKEGIIIVKPIENGAVSDYKGAENIIAHLYHLSLGRFLFFRPEILLSIPLSTTQVERRTLVDAALSAGAKSAFLIEQPIAASIGANIPGDDPTGTMILNIGAGTIECAIISGGTIISSSFVKFGMSKIDKQITNYLEKKKNLNIGEATAEKIKHGPWPMEISGQDTLTNLPKTDKITEEEIQPFTIKISQEIISCTRKVFENSQPELSADIIDKGIIVTGGGSKLKYLNKLIMQSTGLACHIAPHPEECTIMGLGKIIENPDIFKI